MQCIDISGSLPNLLPRLRSALPFLCRYGRHIQSLFLYVEPASGHQSETEARELEALVSSCLAAVGAAGGQLEELEVSELVPLASSAYSTDQASAGQSGICPAAASRIQQASLPWQCYHTEQPAEPASRRPAALPDQPSPVRRIYGPPVWCAGGQQHGWRNRKCIVA